jgi:hypothetical protein
MLIRQLERRNYLSINYLFLEKSNLLINLFFLFNILNSFRPFVIALNGIIVATCIASILVFTVLKTSALFTAKLANLIFLVAEKRFVTEAKWAQSSTFLVFGRSIPNFQHFPRISLLGLVKSVLTAN